MADKQRYNTFTSPAGVAIFPWLTKADVKHDASGVFHTDLSMSPEDAEDFQAQLVSILNEFAAQELTAAQKVALKPRDVSRLEYSFPTFEEGATDEEKAAIRQSFVPEETGNILFRFKLKQHVTTKAGETFTQEPVVVMSDTGARCTDPVYSGSIIRVRGQVIPYSNAVAGEYGVTLRMKAVQVVELKTGTGDGGYWSDFGAEAA